MTHTEFFKNLKNGELAPVYLFTGEEHFVMQSAVNQLTEALVGDLRDVNLSLLPCTAAGDEICAQCETIPFLADKRVVIVEESGFLTKAEPEGVERLLAYLENPADFTVLVFVCAQPEKRRKTYKALQNFPIVEFNPLSDAELSRWIDKTLRGKGLTIEPSALQFLVEYTDPRPEALINELEKLACFKPGGLITSKDITDVVIPCNDYNLYKMTDAVVAGDVNTALTLLSGMLSQREEPIFLLAAIARQYRQLLKCKLLLEKKTPKPEIISLLGIRDFVFSRLSASCQKMSEAQLKQAVDLCYMTDEGLKTGKAFDEAALHALILSLCRLSKRK